jgi:hypothetical protein
MITFSTKIRQFGKQGEKTGWTYIEISKRQAEQLKPGYKKSFRIKGLLDNYALEHAALLPMGDGKFILPVNATMRKGTGKKSGDAIKVKFEVDDRAKTLSVDFIKCLRDDAKALAFFKSLPRGHQNYFSNWIESAKTMPTKTKRITVAVIALASGQGFGEMIRANKRSV